MSCRFWRLFAVLGALLGCASEEPGRVTVQTSEPRPVDAAADNAEVLRQLTPGLLLTLEIDGTAVTLLDVQMALVPNLPARRQEGELITVTGLSGSERVSRAQVPDQRLNVEEQGGLVVLEQRQLTIALPLPRRIDAVEVQLSGEAPPTRLDVRRQLADLCAENPRVKLCAPPLEE